MYTQFLILQKNLNNEIYTLVLFSRSVPDTYAILYLTESQYSQNLFMLQLIVFDRALKCSSFNQADIDSLVQKIS